MGSKKINKILVKGTQTFLRKKIPIIEGGFWTSQKVILVKTIAEIHETRVDKVNSLIRDNIDEFEFGVDIIDLKTKPYQGSVLENNLFTKAQWGNAKNIYLLSERGYTKLVAMLDNRNEKKWEVMDKLIRNNIDEFEFGIDILDLKNDKGFAVIAKNSGLYIERKSITSFHLYFFVYILSFIIFNNCKYF